MNKDEDYPVDESVTEYERSKLGRASQGGDYRDHTMKRYLVNNDFMSFVSDIV